jgi:hypothetical protein
MHQLGPDSQVVQSLNMRVFTIALAILATSMFADAAPAVHTFQAYDEKLDMYIGWSNGNLAGLRTATVTCVGVATIAAAIGAGGLGELIFRGVVSKWERGEKLPRGPAAKLSPSPPKMASLLLPEPRHSSRRRKRK